MVEQTDALSDLSDYLTQVQQRQWHGMGTVPLRFPGQDAFSQ